MKCKNCNQIIVKVVDKWYHKKTSKWFCNTNYAEPKFEDKAKP